MKKLDIIALGALVLLMIAARLFAHSANLTPFLGLALFVGFLSPKYSWGLILPVVALAASDFFLPTYAGWGFVYLALALVGFLGSRLKMTIKGSVVGAVGASLIFFLVSNLGVWWSTGLYSPSFDGLVACYVAAIPFFHRSLTSTLLTSGVCYLVFGLGLERLKVSLAEVPQHG